MEAPFPPLVAGAEVLQRWPVTPDALRARMAALWGVKPAEVLPTRGATHALELLCRRLVRDGVTRIDIRPEGVTDRVLQVAGLLHGALREGAGARVVSSPALDGSGCMSAELLEKAVEDIAPAWLVVDESLIEFEDAPSLASVATRLPTVAVLRSLSFSHGLAGARCGAVIASADLIARLEELLEPFALPTPTIKAAEAALSPSRQIATDARLAELKTARRRVLSALSGAPGVADAAPVGPFVRVTVADPATARGALDRYGVFGEWVENDVVRLALGAPDANDRLLAAFGAAPEPKPRRTAEAVRDTKETRIVVRLDLDTPGGVKVETGNGFFDHMLEQVAVHGGFSLQLGCEGDLHIDPHHAVEDCALAFGQALDKALGDRRGIGRFGFTLPMDETEARISIDLGGRPYAVFVGDFAQSLLGDYPTQMTPHVFRSLSETLRAAIHVEVKGDNDHHKTEACFKAFGRALRSAIRVEGSEMPSSKGVL